MIRNQVTDPADELFDVLTENGDATGIVKRRADVHRDGDWHRAFHLWIVTGTGSSKHRILFQRRSSGKDTWPNRLDVAVGGHYRAGEKVSDVIREINEEVGIEPDLSDLTFAGHRRVVSVRPEWHDRELQDVYMLAFRSRFPTFRPNYSEIRELVQVDISDMLKLFGGHLERIDALVAPVVADRELGDWHSVQISAFDFVPVHDNYWVRGARAAQALLAGSTSVSIADD